MACFVALKVPRKILDLPSHQISDGGLPPTNWHFLRQAPHRQFEMWAPVAHPLGKIFQTRAWAAGKLIRIFICGLAQGFSN